MVKKLLLCIIFPLWLIPALAALAAYPDRPLHLVVPYPPGAGTDTTGRLMAQYLEQGLHQPIVVFNKPGAGGSVGVTDFLKSPADGYTLLVYFSGLPLMPFSYKLSFDPLKEVQPLSLVLDSPYVIVVNPSLPVKSMAELMAYASANPGRLNFATTGSGEPLFLWEMLKKEGHVDIVHVPYKGGTEALNAVLRGEAQMQTTRATSAQQFAREGKLRILAVSTPQRFKIFPDIPTLIESGFPDAVGRNYVGLGVPAGTSREVAARLHAAVVAMTRDADFISTVDKLGLEAVGSTPEEFTAVIKNQVRTWAPYASELGIKPQ